MNAVKITDEVVEAAAKAAFRAAQTEYRAEYDRFPITKTWETTDEKVRSGWRDIARAALEAALPPLGDGRAEIVEALKPFAEAADSIDDTEGDRIEMWEHPASMQVTAADFRRARAAIRSLSNPGGSE